MKKLSLILFAVSLLAFYSCKESFDISGLTKFTENPDLNIGDTLYITAGSPWTGFNAPQDMIIGKDNLMYIADTENNRIVILDLAGRVIGERFVQQPVAIAQDFRLNLLVCGEMTDNAGNTLGAVYKINVVDYINGDFTEAAMDTVLPRTSADYTQRQRRYTGVAVFGDNSYYISRVGTNNSDLNNPDNMILQFNSSNNPIGSGRVPNINAAGTGVRTARGISSLTTFSNIDKDFIAAYSDPEVAYKVQWFEYTDNNQFTGYGNVRFETELQITDLMALNKFGEPQDVALDISNNIYIADAEKDSVFKFNVFGEELESFGGPGVFDSPHAVAHFDETLYVLDTNNNRILRFKLSTDIE